MKRRTSVALAGIAVALSLEAFVFLPEIRCTDCPAPDPPYVKVGTFTCGSEPQDVYCPEDTVYVFECYGFEIGGWCS